MNNLTEKVKQIIRDYENKPILYKFSSKEFDKFKLQAEENFVGDNNRSYFELVISSFQAYFIENTLEYEEAKREYDKLHSIIRNDPLYTSFITNSYSEKVVQEIYKNYISLAPQSIIDEIITKDLHFKKSYQEVISVPTKEQLDSLDDDTQYLLRFLADNDRTPTTLNKLKEIISNKFNEFPLFKNLIEQLIVEPLTNTDSELPFSEPLTRFLTILLTRHIRGENRNGSFTFIVSQVLVLLSIEKPSLLPVIKNIFCNLDKPLEEIPDSKGYENIKNIVGGLLAVMIKNEVSYETAHMVCAHVTHELLKSYEFDIGYDPDYDYPIRKWLWKLYGELQPKILTFMEQFGLFLSACQNRIEELGVPEGFMSSFINALYTIALSLYNLFDKVTEVGLQAVHTVFGTVSNILLEYTYIGRAFFSIALPESRRRPKAVWALLFANDFRRLTPAEKFALSCNIMQEPGDLPSYTEWAQRTADMLNSTNKANVKLEVQIPLRKTRLPENPMVSDSDLAKVVPLLPETNRVATLVQDSIKTWLKAGVPQGIDASWFATPERIHHSLSRYNVKRPDIDMDDKYLMKEVAHAMADQYPHLYKNAIYLTPHAAAEKIKKKYSPGLPFIPQFRSRQQIRDHGFFRAIEEVAKEILETGIPNHTAAHCFEKMNVVDLSKLLLKGDKQKAIVTVVAEDLLSSVVALCALGDLGKRVPKVGDFVMNAVKRTEGGFMPFYEEVEKRKTIIQADAKQFDSSLGPLIAVEGLSELRGIGYQGSAIEQVAKSQIRSRYIQLKDSLLVSLIDGQTHGHTGGLMTGQALTPTDNRDAFRMVIIFCWSKATGKPPSEFYKTNTLGNAGDDNVWGSDDGEEIMIECLTHAKKSLGVEVLVEERGFNNIDLTGLQIIPVPEHSKMMYINMGLSIPRFSLRTTPEKLLMKKTEFKVTLSRLNDFQFYAAHIDVLIGSAMLTAHNLPIYDHFCTDYMREMEYVLLRFFKEVEWEVTYSDEGYKTSVIAHPKNPRNRTNETTLSHFKKWLKCHRMMSYENIFKIWLQPNDMDKSKMVKSHAKFLALNPQLSQLDKANWGLLLMREALYKYIPTHVARALPEFEGMDLTISLRNSNFIICKFVWLSYYRKHKKIPTASLLNALLRENPYSSAEDPVSFIDWLSQENSIKQLVSMDLELLRGQMLAITIVYYFIENITKSFSYIPGLGFFYQLFILSTRDVNRLYSLLNYIYMISEGRSSPIISNMMPPDPFAWIKQLSVLLTCIFPPRFYGIFPGLKHVVKLLPNMVEWWAAADQISHPNIARRIASILNTPREWEKILKDLSDATNNLKQGDALIIAPTGTGKSTAFVKGLFQNLRFEYTIWLTQPTKTARDNYENPFLHKESIQILFKGVVNNNAKRLKILTPGHFCQRFLMKEVDSRDIVIIDECHLLQTTQLYAWFYSRDLCRMQITATPPKIIFPRPANVLNYIGGKRFKTNTVNLNMTLEDLIVFLYKENREILRRALIVAPTKRKVRKIIMTLSRLSLESYELSSDIPVANQRGIIVATTIVDTAVTILPPPSCLIDLGETIEVNYIHDNSFFPNYKIDVVPTPPSTHTQRIGRVGRSGDSIAYLLNKGGTGEEKQNLPSVRELLFDVDYCSQILNAYNIRLGIIRQNNKTNSLLDFICVSSGFQQININPNSLLVAMLIISELSGGLMLEDIRIRFEHYKLNNVLDEDYNIIVEQLQMAVDGSLIMGVWQEGIDILESNLLGFQMYNKTFIPAVCLLVKKNYIVPNTYSQDMILGSMISLPLQDVNKLSKKNFWLEYKEFVDKINFLPFEDTLGDYVSHQNFYPLPKFKGNIEIIPITTLKGNAILSVLRAALIKIDLFKEKNTRSFIEIVFNDDTPLFDNMEVLHITNRVCNKIRNSKHMDVSEISLGNNSFKMVWVMIISALLPDNFVITYNNDDMFLVNSVHHHKTMIISKSEDTLVLQDNLVLSPLRIRNYAFDIIYRALTDDHLAEYIYNIPVDIFISAKEDINVNALHSDNNTFVTKELSKMIRTNINGSFINNWKQII